MISALDIFRIGIGPSSSHTVGPMRIANRFLADLEKAGLLDHVHRFQISTQGSLAYTGAGHRTPEAICLGLLGFVPETTDPVAAEAALAALKATSNLCLPTGRSITFDPSTDLVADYETVPTLHPNGMRLQAFGSDGALVADQTFYSTGGGFIASQKQLETPLPDDLVGGGPEGPMAFRSARELLELCARHNLAISDVMLANEARKRPREVTLASLDAIAAAMAACIDRGLTQRGILPGGLHVRRRAPDLYNKLIANPMSNERETLFDWLNAYAMAVNEENAAGGRVVTAPTNGAAGIIPAILRFYLLDVKAPRETVHGFLLTAGAIGILYKQRASISGAEMGCQGEVGVACSMAAGALAAVWGGTPSQVANAAEIGMEHNLGLTCDPVGGLVQIPCIERNALAAVKAANAARLALQSHEAARVSLDQVIETMRQTGLDMSSKYKETSLGGLAVNVVEC
ncbi:L-serine dehydratase 1 [Candidatus Phycosocius bacilliformis]|uniref:L-serine dehydratase n=1 Tax=Candidatus Phycosocius bacilliformis TaxID=1445552 RepID=A0A2P2EE55_9PROT|nr:L-serine dehydratase 1 [Candidatus Phycosocius bacilliformis]